MQSEAKLHPASAPLTKIHEDMFPKGILPATLLGPLVGILIWLSPLGLEPTIQHAIAIVAFMIVYWITEPIEHAMTALIGCYLFWAFHVTKFSVAFSGFASTTPWLLFGAMLMGQAASQTGLAKRLGYMVMQRVGTSYSHLLFGVITLTFLLNFLIPSGVARLAATAPILLGIIKVFDLRPNSNVAKGLFIILSYNCGLFDKMIMSGAAAILTRGIIEEMTGIQVLWSQWFMAYLPVTLITVFASWLVIQWFYPAEKEERELPGGVRYLQDSLKEMGAWSREETKTLVWLLLAISLWATDFIHRTSPAVIGIGIGLFLALPKVGVLDAKAVNRVNFLLIVFSAGALSMGNVLMQTNALNVLTDSLVEWMKPLLSNSFYSAATLYFGGVLYHLLLANEQSMLSTSLPLLLQIGDTQGYNPTALGLLWAFASGGRLFVYQSSVLVLGYSYGYFETKDLIKVGAVLTIVEGLLVMLLVPFYWPLIGLNWIK